MPTTQVTVVSQSTCIRALASRQTDTTVTSRAEAARAPCFVHGRVNGDVHCHLALSLCERT